MDSRVKPGYDKEVYHVPGIETAKVHGMELGKG